MGAVDGAAHGGELFLGSVHHGVDVTHGGGEPVQRPLGKVAVFGYAAAHCGVSDLQQDGPPGPCEQNGFRPDVSQAANHAATLPAHASPMTPAKTPS